MSTEVAKITTAVSVKSFFEKDTVKQKFTELMGKKSQGFITSILQCVSQNKLLANADTNSIYQAAMMAATLDLPINNNLGFAYIIPYNTKYQDPNDGTWKEKQVASFQMGYKGFIQLAQRSGAFKTISACPIYEGQLKSQNPLTGFEFDFSRKSSDVVIGYASYFQLLNGFEKTLYMTVEELQKHGAKFSKTYKNAYGLWKTDFDNMAIKTVTKLLLSKFAPLSIEMQKSINVDQAVINDVETEDIDYVDRYTESEEAAILKIEDAQANKPASNTMAAMAAMDKGSATTKEVKEKSAKEELPEAETEATPSEIVFPKVEELSKAGARNGKNSTELTAFLKEHYTPEEFEMALTEFELGDYAGIMDFSLRAPQEDVSLLFSKLL